MQRQLLPEAEGYERENVRRRLWRKVVRAMACVVVFCTTYALILPAITMEKDTLCGFDEHTHSETCYTQILVHQVSELNCTSASLGVHAHTDDCYDQDNILRCGYADYVIHKHTADCFDESNNLICEIPELIEHKHTLESCYELDQTEASGYRLVCRETEAVPHRHEDSCYETITDEMGAEQKILICAQLETVVHIHDEDCFTEKEVAADTECLTCSLTENDNHVHNSLCYGEWALSCDIQEHTHTEECYADASVETSTEATIYGEISQPIMPERNEVSLLAVETVTKVASGTLEGTDLTWTVTKNASDEYTITIDGQGAMPNYTADNYLEAPWREWRKMYSKLVFGPGVTRIGDYAFREMYLSSIEWGGVSEIGTHSFSYIQGMTKVKIPGTVKTIGDRSFTFSQVHEVELEEGVETILTSAFFNYDANVGYTVHIPSSVTYVGPNAFHWVDEFTVAENSQYYTAVDGVLYSKDKTILIAYPRVKVSAEFRIPDFVEKVQQDAFSYVTGIKKLVIPSGVQLGLEKDNPYGVGRDENYGYFQNSQYESVIMEDGVTFVTTPSMMFYSTRTISEIRLPEDPENFKYYVGNWFYSYQYANLEEFKYPNAVSSIGRMFNKEIKGSLPSLNKVTYDCIDASIEKEEILGENAAFDLVIGPSVDNLKAAFTYFATHALSITFKGENTFTAEAGAFTGAGKPLEGLSGPFYVDAQGVLYSYDASTKTAKVVYCSPNVEAVSIPATITPDDGNEYTVTAVGANALQHADTLTSIVFANPENIVMLETMAMANCSNLASVNGFDTVSDAETSFPKATLGYNVFLNTALGEAPGTGSFEMNMNGIQNLQISATGADPLNIMVQSSGDTMTWKPNGEGEKGGYSLLTGDTLSIVASVGNTETNTEYAYRVYIQRTSDEGSLSVTAGQSYLFDGQTVTCFATNDPYTVYLEFTPSDGATLSVPITAVYPSPESYGGGVTVWGVIIPLEQTSVEEGKILYSQDGTIQACWHTEPDSFALSKTAVGSNPGVVSDGNGGSKPGAGLSWQIDLIRAEDVVSAYGKDYARSADFTDVLILPDGISWSQSVVEALQQSSSHRNGNSIYAGDVLAVTLKNNGTGNSLRSVRLYWDATLNDVVLKWGVVGNDIGVEMNATSLTVTIHPDALSIDMSKYPQGMDTTITNQVTANVHYHYSKDQLLTAASSHSIGGGKGTINIKKTSSTVKFLGEDVNYEIKLYNDGGLPWYADKEGVYTVRDRLDVSSYIRPENMERMFNDEYGDRLTITINNAVLGTCEKVVGVDGTESWRHPGNSDIGPVKDDNVLTITKTDDLYYVTVSDGRVYSDTSLETALRYAGYGVTLHTVYECVWKLNNETERFTLSSGEHRLFSVFATLKDTNQRIGQDWLHQFEQNSISVTNYSYVDAPDQAGFKVSNVTNYVKREAQISKRVYRDGVRLTDSTGINVNSGDVLDYEIIFNHFGKGDYYDLPIVDDLYGSQYLLVPVDQNQNLAALNLEKDDSGEYYVLTEGTYSNVTVGVDDEGRQLIAASIVVQMASGDTVVELGGNKMIYRGLHTKIKWYFPELKGDNDYQMTISYKALVQTQELSYTIGNVAWMGDRLNTRIYAPIWGSGTLLDLEKDIVIDLGDKTPADDVLDEDKYSLIGRGDTVVYRLTVSNPRDYSYVLNGTEMADALPDTIDVFQWEKGVNVKYLGYELSEPGIADCVGLEDADWHLADEYLGMVGDYQFICWDKGTQISFSKSGEVYLYFQLTFPDNPDVWDTYSDAVGGNDLDNTFYVYYFPATVDHNLLEDGKVLLQKGVYGQYCSAPSKISWYTPGASRHFYNNRDQKDRSIVYYVVLYNGANKRLYLNDLVDTLPRGFTYVQLLNQDIMNASIPTTQIHAVNTIGGLNQGSKALTAWGTENVAFMNAKISATPTQTGVVFTIGEGTGDYAVKWDDECQQYYLAKDEAIVFGYVCDIGETAQTDDTALNSIQMEYTEYLGTKVFVIDPADLSIGAPTTGDFNESNDGNRLLKETPDKKYLASEVTVERGGIIPGITKFTESYITNGTTNATPYTNHVGPFDTVNWRVQVDNSGTLSLTDYTFTDVMPKPYVFEGDVIFSILNSRDEEIDSATLVTIPEHTGEETYLTINGKTVSYGGSAVEYYITRSSRYVKYQVSISRDSSGNEVLTIHFSDLYLTIPEGGTLNLWFSSRNPTKNFANTVYTNHASIFPNVQDFKSTGQGSAIEDSQKKPIGVTNTSPVTVSFGYATSSYKQITEATDPENTAISMDPSDNYIVLSEGERDVRYTLTVGNDTEKAMTKLVVIDTLPMPGDHSPFDKEALRNSDFSVELSDDPGFEVQITTKDGTTTTLDPSAFTVQFSNETEFDAGDWDGTNDDSWTADAANAKSIRIIILDSSAELIPADSRISISFHARVSEDAKPGQIAWNSFGYHYALKDVTQELEAMPLNVGVKIPSVPRLEKKLVDLDGNPAAAPSDATFNFLIYQGSSLGIEDEEELCAKLDAAYRAYRKVSVTVKEGESASEQMQLILDGWSWVAGESFTVVELPVMDNAYEFGEINYFKDRSHTFVYDPDKTYTITCENVYRVWSAHLTKVDSIEQNQVLQGAVFALYGPDPSAAKGPMKYEDLTIPATHKVDGVEWYLTNVGTTGADGTLTLDGLVETQYYLVEIRPPDGYLTAEEGWLLDRNDAHQGLYSRAIPNLRGYELPMTGGAGTTCYTMGGLLLMAAVVILLYMQNRKTRKEGRPSS